MSQEDQSQNRMSRRKWEKYKECKIGLFLYKFHISDFCNENLQISELKLASYVHTAHD